MDRDLSLFFYIYTPSILHESVLTERDVEYVGIRLAEVCLQAFPVDYVACVILLLEGGVCGGICPRGAGMGVEGVG